MKSIIKDLFWKLVTFFSREGDAASILMYHSVGNNGAFFTVRQESFETQLEYLRTHHFNVVTLSSLLEKIQQGQSLAHTVAITFDDGYKDNYEVAFPLLKKYQMPATIFLTAGFVGGSMKLKDGTVLPMLAQQEIQEMVESGFIECMPHTMNHVRYVGDNLEVFMREVRESRQTVESLTGKAAPIFAYPAGKYDLTLVESIKQEGFKGAVTVEEGLVHARADIFMLKRNAVDSSTTFSQFRGKVSRAIDWYVTCKNLFSYAEK